MAETVRKCHAEDCDLPATHHVMWVDGPLYYCQRHADKMVRVGAAVGLGAARTSLRWMTPDEMMVDLGAEALAAEISEIYTSKGLPDATPERILQTVTLMSKLWSLDEYERFADLHSRLFRMKKEGG
ncbi:MAG: hypothetical protein CL607_15095 [Anaerolineaceae bacterium]|nr:hypothetical protein [Anaerolineaceae bacterium]